MSIINLSKKSLDKLYITVRRFPFALLFSTLTTFTMIYVINLENYYSTETQNILGRLVLILALGFPLSLVIKLSFERLARKIRIHLLIPRAISLFALAGYYHFFLSEISMVTVSRYIVVSFSLYLLFLVVPYFYRKNDFELYVVRLFFKLAVSGVYSAVLFGGASAIIFTLNELLNIPVSEHFYVTAFLTVGGIFAPIFFLPSIPEANADNDLKEYPNILEILLRNIVMPLIAVYTTILYLYFIKIIISQQLPQGSVTHLVLWFASFSIIILFFISPLKHKNRWVRIFKRWLPRALVPLLLLMFLAIGIRINAYGFTESRYFVVVLGLWNLGIALYFGFTRKKNNIVLPLTLAIVALLSVFGPWSSYSVSISSQNSRFTQIVSQYGMVENNKIVPGDAEIAEEAREEIHSILRYFANYHGLEDLRYLPADFETEDTVKFFGFSYQQRPGSRQYFSYNLRKKRQAILLENFDYLFHLTERTEKIAAIDASVTVSIEGTDKEIIIVQNGKEIYRRSAVDIVNELHQQNKDIFREELEPEDFIVAVENDNLYLKFIFNSFMVRVTEADRENITVENLDFYLLLSTLT